MIQDYRVSEQPVWRLIAQEALGIAAAAGSISFSTASGACSPVSMLFSPQILRMVADYLVPSKAGGTELRS